MASKKIVFVIVEGPSDDEALGLLLSRLYDKNEVIVYITHGDLTTKPDADSKTIVSEIGNIISGYAASNHFDKQHFQEIIHIFDTDGAYIPDDAITEDELVEKVVYSPTTIRTKYAEKIKRECLERISRMTSSWGVPYQAYYMSCNLDHVLYDKLNLSDDEKEHHSIVFSKKYKDDVNGFVKFISESNFSVTSGYIESWAFIKDGFHSLERHTNLGICLKKISK